jgi:hypothetical protein
MNIKHFFKNDGAAIVVVSGILLIIGFKFFPENPALIGYIPHPYFIISILFSAYAGLRSAIVMSIVLSLQILLILHFNVDYQEVETILDYKYLSIPITILIISVVLGEFKTRQNKKVINFKIKQAEQDEIIKSLMGQVEFLNEESQEIKKELVSKLDTFVTASSRMKRFQLKDENDIIFELMDLLETDLGVTKARAFMFKESTGSYSATVPEENDNDILNDPLFLAAIETKKPASIKEHLRNNPNTKTLLMACYPIVQEEKVTGVIAILELNFLDYTPGNMLSIKQIIHWAEACLDYAKEIRILSQNSIINPELRIHTRQYFLDRLIEEHEFAQRYNKTIHIIKVEIDGLMSLAPLKKSYARKLISQNLISTLRKMDCICEGARQDVFYVILHLPDPTHSQFAVERVRVSMENLVKQTSSPDALNTDVRLIEHSNFSTLENFIEIISNA